jgi:hypothetical protein
VARELEEGALEEWTCGRGGPGTSDGDGWPARSVVPRQRAWHVVVPAGHELTPTAGLFLNHLVTTGGAGAGDRFRLVDAA